MGDGGGVREGGSLYILIYCKYSYLCGNIIYVNYVSSCEGS